MTMTTIISSSLSQVASQNDAKLTTAASSGDSSFSKVMNKVSSSDQTDQKTDQKVDKNTATDNGSDKNKSATEKSTASDQNTQMDKTKSSAADQTDKTDKTDTKKSSADTKSSTDDDQTGKTKDVTQTDQSEAALLAMLQTGIQQISDKMVNAVADALHVSTGAVTEMMQKLNMTATDLLQPDQLKNLVLALNGDTDGTSLLTNGNLYATVKNLFGTLQDMESQLQTQTGLSEKQIQQFLQNLQTGTAEKGDTTDQTQTKAQTQTDSTLNVLPAAAALQDNTDKKAGNTETSNAATVVQTTTTDKTTEKSIANAGSTDKTESSSAISDDFKLTGSGKQETSQSENQPGSSTNQYIMNFEKSLDQITESQTTETKPVFTLNDPDEVISQIVDYIKVQVKPETSHLEMQLHPENLGTLNIQLSSKEGVMTAQFTTQSEEVRSVIQSQIADLRQSLENQGIKVNAVEVTVANYSQNNGSADNQQSDNQTFTGKKRGTRAINLNVLNETDESLNQDDQITAQMMKANGSTVDYTV